MFQGPLSQSEELGITKDENVLTQKGEEYYQKKKWLINQHDKNSIPSCKNKLCGNKWIQNSTH